MNKILIGISILLGTVLIITNFATGTSSVHIIVGWSSPGMLALVGIIIGVILGIGLKGFISEKSLNQYDNEEGIDF